MEKTESEEDIDSYLSTQVVNVSQGYSFSGSSSFVKFGRLVLRGEQPLFCSTTSDIPVLPLLLPMILPPE